MTRHCESFAFFEKQSNKNMFQVSSGLRLPCFAPRLSSTVVRGPLELCLLMRLLVASPQPPFATHLTIATISATKSIATQLTPRHAQVVFLGGGNEMDCSNYFWKCFSINYFYQGKPNDSNDHFLF